jgi:uncharacterized membrane protein YraQ (UPF0718 family)
MKYPDILWGIPDFFLRRVLRMSTIVFLSILVVGMILLTYKTHGTSGLTMGFTFGGNLLRNVGPLILLGFLLAGLLQVMVPRELIGNWLGAESGFKGILIATGAGALSPGGPFIQFPLLAVLHRSGAGYGPLAAFITAWSVFQILRIVVYDIPFMGVQFFLARSILLLAAPILVGLATPWMMTVVTRLPFLSAR